MKIIHRISLTLTLAALPLAAPLRAQTTSGIAAPALTLAPADAHSGGSAGGGETESENTAALAKAAQNPVAKLISVPLQNNFNFGVGPNDVMQYVLNIQPVIPITLSEDWNLITRTVMPIISQASPAPGVPSAAGLGDINPSFFLSPAKAGKLIWGVGPTFTFPTATDSLLGAGKWSAGPTVVALTMPGKWVLGALANNQWSYAGWGTRSVNQMLLQYFINYNLPHGWYLTSSPIITADWEADNDNRWTIPFGGGVGKIQRLGKLPVNFQLGAYWNAETPKDFGADWQLRFQMQLMFPK